MAAWRPYLFSDQSENVLCITTPQRESSCQVSERSLLYYLRNSGNKLSMSKSKMAAWRPYLFSDPPENVLCTTRPQGDPICEISERSIQYFLRNSGNKIVYGRTTDGPRTQGDLISPPSVDGGLKTFPGGVQEYMAAQCIH